MVIYITLGNNKEHACGTPLQRRRIEGVIRRCVVACRTPVVLTSLCLLFSGLSFSQSNNARISGTVTDLSGALIPGASITVTNQLTKTARALTTDAKGFYILPDLPAGTYDVAVEANGFRKAEKVGYDLADASSITADFKLEIGTINQTMTVTEVLGETVNTVSGELGTTIDSEQVQDLQLNGRNYLQLVSLVPGVALLDEDQMATTTSLSVTTWAANGTRPGSNHLMVDGGMNLDSGSNGSQVNNVGVDFVRPGPRPDGRHVGAIRAQLRSGGQRRHQERRQQLSRRRHLHHPQRRPGRQGLLRAHSNRFFATTILPSM